MSEDIAGDRKRTWRCPACQFEAAIADELAAHVQHVHIGPAAWVCPSCRFEATTASGLVSHVQQVHLDSATWRCPAEECKDQGKPFSDAQHFAAHLERHILQRRKREATTCLKAGCTFQAGRGHLCWTHWREARREKRAKKAK